MHVIHVSVNRTSLRRSTMSPMAPAGSAKIKNGRELAVCVRATRKGLPLRESMSHAAPTFCINVPTSETTSATRRLRNVGIWSGRHNETGFAESRLTELGTWLRTPEAHIVLQWTATATLYLDHAARATPEKKARIRSAPYSTCS